MHSRAGRAVGLLPPGTLSVGAGLIVLGGVVPAYAVGCGAVAAALVIALLRHAPKPAGSAVAREVRA
jgi:hypothetical protein